MKVGRLNGAKDRTLLGCGVFFDEGMSGLFWELQWVRANAQ